MAWKESVKHPMGLFILHLRRMNVSWILLYFSDILYLRSMALAHEETSYRSGKFHTKRTTISSCGEQTHFRNYNLMHHEADWQHLHLLSLGYFNSISSNQSPLTSHIHPQREWSVSSFAPFCVNWKRFFNRQKKNPKRSADSEIRFKPGLRLHQAWPRLKSLRSDIFLRSEVCEH